MIETVIDPALVSRFAADLAGKKRRLDWQDFADAFMKAHPVHAHNLDGQERLWEAVKRAAEAGQIQLPARTGKSWTRFGRTERPHFLMIPQTETPAFTDNHPWHPDMIFARGEKPGQKRDLLIDIDRWIREKRATALTIPIKERSIEICGDEKRLERYRSRAGFFQDALRLDQLKCQLAPLPIPIELGANPAGKPVLVIENADSFHSFARWNRRVQRFSGVAYGGGGHRALAFEDGYLDLFLAEHGGRDILYFGDIDAAGIQIPAGASEKRQALGLPPFLPALAFYDWLLQNGVPAENDQTRILTGNDAAWISPFAGAINGLISNGKRIAQEWLSTTVLERGIFDRL